MRNAEFDREKVLRAAMSLFMEKGYSKTSMPDLKKVTGLHPGSIYCAFENKRGLLLAAIAQYKADRNAEFSQFFLSDETILAQLKKYLDHMVNECVSGDPAKGCLFIKTLYESTEEDQFLIMGIYGLRTFAQSNPDPETLKALAEQLFNSIDN